MACSSLHPHWPNGPCRTCRWHRRFDRPRRRSKRCRHDGSDVEDAAYAFQGAIAIYVLNVPSPPGRDTGDGRAQDRGVASHRQVICELKVQALAAVERADELAGSRARAGSGATARAAARTRRLRQQPSQGALAEYVCTFTTYGN